MNFFFVPKLSVRDRRKLRATGVLCVHADLENERGALITDDDLGTFLATIPIPRVQVSVGETKYEWLWRLETGELGNQLNPHLLETAQRPSFSSLEIPAGTLEDHLVKLCLRLRDRARNATHVELLEAERHATSLIAVENANRQALAIRSQVQVLLETKMAEGRVRSKEQIFLDMTAHPQILGLVFHERMFLARTKSLRFVDLEENRQFELGEMQFVFVKKADGLRSWAAKNGITTYCCNCSRLVSYRGTADYSHPLFRYSYLNSEHPLKEKLIKLTVKLLKAEQLEALLHLYLGLLSYVDPIESNVPSALWL